jgi:hypothetical protein
LKTPDPEPFLDTLNSPFRLFVAILTTVIHLEFNVHYLYASKKALPLRLVATFDSEQQLLAYVRWATLEETGERSGKFEQGSALAGFSRWDSSREPLTDDDQSLVEHNPTPSML